MSDKDPISMPPGRILVVDDEPTVRDVVKKYLEYHDLYVVGAGDGLEALDHLRAEMFDVVVSDIMMPQMDGLELVGEATKIQPDIMVILMTGYASVNTAVEAIKKGVFDFVLKPFQNMETIHQTVARALEKKRLTEERDFLIKELRSANQQLAYHRELLDRKVARIDSELARRVERITALYEVGRSITSITDQHLLLDTIMGKISTLMTGTSGILWLAEPQSPRLRRVVTSGLGSDEALPQFIDRRKGAIGETVRSASAQIFKTIDMCDDVMLRQFAEANDIESLVTVPLQYENEILGVIVVLFPQEFTVTDDDVSLLVSVADQASVSIKNAELFARQNRLFHETIEALATAIDSRDNYTGNHSYMVTEFAIAIAAELGFDADRLELVRVAGLLHDVGKIGISDSILNKPGRLTDEEMGVIKAHPILGRIILESIDALKPVARLVYHHHERYDGKGYPEGVAGENIPLESRILQVADIFHALTSDRIYRKAMPLEKAVSIIEEGLGTVSDPVIGQLFLAMVRDGRLDVLLAQRL